jgi:peroxiredoxin-like protein
MKPLPHYYEVRLGTGGFGYERLSGAGLPSLRVGLPLNYDGPGDAWTPEQLLLASVSSCFVLTLRSIARFSKVDLVDVAVEATGTVDRSEGVTRFTEIVLRPAISVSAGTDRERVARVVERAEKNCLVSASLATRVRMECEIKEPETVAAKIA